MKILLAALLLMIVSMWRVFTKAGEPGWAVLIPIYNAYVFLKIAQKPGWWLILFFIPFVNIVVWIIAAVAVARYFGKGSGFAVGMILLPIVFYPILAFGDAQYSGGGSARSTPGPPRISQAAPPSPEVEEDNEPFLVLDADGAEVPRTPVSGRLSAGASTVTSTPRPASFFRGARLNLEGEWGFGAGIAIAAGYLWLVFFAAIEHNSISDVGAAIIIGLFGGIAGIAATVADRTLRVPVRRWAQAGIGLAALFLSVGFFPTFGSFGESPFFSGELVVLYGGGSGNWACALILLFVALGCLQARDRVPSSALTRYLLAGVAGVALMACLIQLLIWMALGHDSALSMAFHSDALMIIFAVSVYLSVLAILIVALYASVSVDHTSIQNMARANMLILLAIFVAVCGGERDPFCGESGSFVRSDVWRLRPHVVWLFERLSNRLRPLGWRRPSDHPRIPDCAG